MHGPTMYFIIVILLIQALISWTVYRLLTRLVPVFNLRSIRYSYCLVTLITVVVTSLSRWLYAAGVPAEWLICAFVWLIALTLMLPFLVVLQGIAYLISKKKKVTALPSSGSSGMTRRDFLRNSIAAVPVLSFGLSASGAYNDTDITIQRHALSLPKFPVSLGNLKLVQISDTHIGPFFDMEKLDQVVAMIQLEKPDMVIITGDLIDDLTLLAPTMERLAKMQASLPYGMYFCWGNHEYFRDIAKIRQALENSPIILLENNSRQIVGGEHPFYLLGVDYPWANNGAEQIEKRQLYMEKTLRNVPDEAFSILLSHHPDFIDNAFEAKIPLTLSGHTHGGQIGLFGRTLLPLSYKYMRGMYQRENMYGYVSTGAGNWLPFRLGCPAEIAVFTLSRLH